MILVVIYYSGLEISAISVGVDISEVPGCHLFRQMSSPWGSQKLLQGLVSQLTF